jgi:FkbH-like protein
MNNYEGDAVVRGLDEVLVNTQPFVLVHSALHRLPIKRAIKKFALLRCFNRWALAGKTILFPTFTFDFTRSGVYYKDLRNSEVGMLGEWVLDLDSAVRTDHPIYSVAAIGPRLGEVLSCDQGESFGSGGLFHHILTTGVSVVMLGAKWENCTLFHCLEQEAAVPYRYLKKFTGKKIEMGITHDVETQMYVRDENMGVENDFTQLIGKITPSVFQAVALPECRSIDGRELHAIGSEILAKDQFAFVKNSQSVMWACQMKKQRATQPPVAIYLYGSENNEFLAQRLSNRLRSLGLPRDFSVECPSFGQQQSTLLKRKSPPDYILVVERLITILNGESSEPDLTTSLSCLLESFLSEIQNLGKRNSATVFVNSFTIPSASEALELEVKFASDIATLVSKANSFICEGLREYRNIEIVPTEIAEAVPERQGGSAKIYQLSRSPFSLRQLDILSLAYSRKILQRVGLSLRLIVVDLDNTLWGGVIGEAGIKSIELGGDFPGGSFKRFQTTLRCLSKKGIALAICSKNDEEIVFEVFNQHPEMTLALDDFVAYRINWKDKASNIEEMVRELGLGFESVGFVDDNPVENDRVRNQCPGIKIIDMGKDPALFSERLLSSPFVSHEILTKEDRKRVSGYHARTKSVALRRNTNSLSEFFRELDVKIFVQDLNDYNISRAAQLIQKTNQFNSTCTRYSEDQLQRDLGEVFVIAAQDRFHEKENVGILAISSDELSRKSNVRLFLLSCRALGKGIEEELVIWLTKDLKMRGSREIFWNFLKNPRNHIVDELLASFGMTKHQDYYSGELRERVNPENPFVSVIDERAKQRDSSEDTLWKSR